MDSVMDKLNNFADFIDSRFLHIVHYLDNHILRNLGDANIETRPSTSSGLWCLILLPAVLVLNSLQYKVSPLYHIVTYLSVGMCLYSILFILFLSVSSVVLNENIHGGCVACCLASTLLMYSFTNTGLLLSLGISVLSIYFYSCLLRHTILQYQKTFTIGEAIIVTQSIVLFLAMIVLRICFNLGDYSDGEMEFVYKVNLSILTTVGIIVTALYNLNDDDRDMQSLWYIVAMAGTYTLVILHLSLGVDCLFTLFGYVIFDLHKVKLVALWGCLAAAAVFILVVRTKVAIKASTVTRKTFHILASLVFFTGYIYDLHLITLAAGCGLGAIVLVEALRKSKIEPISSQLQAAFLVYSDEKDVGSFAMTPLYLYIGLACPLLLVPLHRGYELELLSGVLSIGVGDTAASWYGSNYGTKKWTGVEKTQEGTAFNILCQLAVVYGLYLFNLLNVNFALVRAFITAVVSGLVEAKTDQVDNLTLPLVTIISFQLTSVLCL